MGRCRACFTGSMTWTLERCNGRGRPELLLVTRTRVEPQCGQVRKPCFVLGIHSLRSSVHAPFSVARRRDARSERRASPQRGTVARLCGNLLCARGVLSCSPSPPYPPTHQPTNRPTPTPTTTPTPTPTPFYPPSTLGRGPFAEIIPTRRCRKKRRSCATEFCSSAAASGGDACADADIAHTTGTKRFTTSYHGGSACRKRRPSVDRHLVAANQPPAAPHGRSTIPQLLPVWYNRISVSAHPP